MLKIAVMYPTRIIPPAIYEILRFNPLLQLVDLARQVLFGHYPMIWAKLGFVYACAAVALLAGHVCFSRLRSSFAEVI